MTEIIAALDVDTLRQAEELIHLLHGTIRHYKIGMRLFTRYGKRAIDSVLKRDGEVFLDLKLFDIPETVSQAVRQTQKLGVHAVSVHLLGGTEMLKAAADVSPRPQLWGVTILTSITDQDLKAIHPSADVYTVVERLARLGQSHHLDGTICSARDVPSLQKRLKPDACFITPGIRPSGSGQDDQRRIMTPGEAARLGIRYIVIGRPIIKAPDPLKAAQDILREMKHAAPKSLEVP